MTTNDKDRPLNSGEKNRGQATFLAMFSVARGAGEWIPSRTASSSAAPSLRRRRGVPVADSAGGPPTPTRFRDDSLAPANRVGAPLGRLSPFLKVSVKSGPPQPDSVSDVIIESPARPGPDRMTPVRPDLS